MLQFPRKINPRLLPDDDADMVLLEELCQGLWSCSAPGSAVPTTAPGCSSPSPQAAPPAPITARPHPRGRMHPTHRSMMLLLNWRSHVTDFICSSSSCILPDTQRGTYTGAARRPLPAGEAEAVAEQQGCPKPRSLSRDDTGQPQPHTSPAEPEPWCCPTEDEQQAGALSPRHQAVHEPPSKHSLESHLPVGLAQGDGGRHRGDQGRAPFLRQGHLGKGVQRLQRWRHLAAPAPSEPWPHPRVLCACSLPVGTLLS